MIKIILPMLYFKLPTIEQFTPFPIYFYFRDVNDKKNYFIIFHNIFCPKIWAYYKNLSGKIEEISKTNELLLNENPARAAQNKQKGRITCCPHAAILTCLL